jgi:tRNA-Thr(GGU) m(6)t(6)A37 methyltransferase TsaA
MSEPIVFHPIGVVRNQIPGPRYHDWAEVVSEIILDDKYAPALDGIEEYSHVEVLFYIAGVTNEQRHTLKLHPQGRADSPLVGIFATHTQFRPNPIGITVARLLERQGSRLRVQGLDAYDGTPILDIKAYAPRPGEMTDIVIPDWLTRMREETR